MLVVVGVVIVIVVVFLVVAPAIVALVDNDANVAVVVVDEVAHSQMKLEFKLKMGHSHELNEL